MKPQQEKLETAVMVKMTSSLRDTLKELAQQNERSLSAEVRLAIKRYLRDQQIDRD